MDLLLERLDLRLKGLKVIKVRKLVRHGRRNLGQTQRFRVVFHVRVAHETETLPKAKEVAIFEVAWMLTLVVKRLVKKSIADGVLADDFLVCDACVLHEPTKSAFTVQRNEKASDRVVCRYSVVPWISRGCW